MRKLRNIMIPANVFHVTIYLLTLGRSQDRIDGTGTEERGGAGIVAGRDTQEHRMLRA